MIDRSTGHVETTDIHPMYPMYDHVRSCTIKWVCVRRSFAAVCLFCRGRRSIVGRRSVFRRWSFGRTASNAS